MVWRSTHSNQKGENNMIEHGVIIEKIVNKIRNKVDKYAILLTSTDETMIKYSNSQPSIVQSWNSYEVGMYLVKDKRVMVAGLRNPDERILESFVNNSIISLEKLEVTDYLPDFSSARTHDALYANDKRILDLKTDLKSILDVVSSRITHNMELAGMISIGQRKILLETSTGFKGEHINTFFNGYFRIFQGERSGQWAFSSTFYDEKLLESAIDKAMFYSSLNLPFVKVPEGEYKVILSPMVAGNIINLLASMSSAFAIENGLSFLRPEHLGEKIASSKLSVYDTPLNIELPFNVPFDAEGYQTYNKPIIEEGVLKNILHNSVTAKKFNTKSTGNAGWIEPAPWNIEVGKGDASFEELITEAKNGILVNNNWYTRFQNYTTGEFSTVGRDAIIVIENGEMKGLLKKARISSNYPSLLRNIELVGKERYKIKWWEVENPTLIPYILVDRVRITIPEYPS